MLSLSVSKEGRREAKKTNADWNRTVGGKGRSRGTRCLLLKMLSAPLAFHSWHKGPRPRNQQGLPSCHSSLSFTCRHNMLSFWPRSESRHVVTLDPTAPDEMAKKHKKVTLTQNRTGGGKDIPDDQMDLWIWKGRCFGGKAPRGRFHLPIKPFAQSALLPTSLLPTYIPATALGRTHPVSETSCPV